MKNFKEFEMPKNAIQSVVGGAEEGIKLSKHKNEHGTIIKIDFTKKEKEK